MGLNLALDLSHQMVYAENQLQTSKLFFPIHVFTKVYNCCCFKVHDCWYYCFNQSKENINYSFHVQWINGYVHQVDTEDVRCLLWNSRWRSCWNRCRVEWWKPCGVKVLSWSRVDLESKIIFWRKGKKSKLEEQLYDLREDE